ncbi:MAG: DUF6429 family protein [Planctomycetota bacterium]|nr:DUF6429 family protein [Planctomycetota bacterium]MDA1179600.1 DUF6429 family protein [Planctomycetota bacterium]
MEYDDNKIADVVLALLSLTMHDESEFGCRAWKGHDWSVLDRLYEHGFISDPKNSSKSVWLTQAGVQRSQALFNELFAKRDVTTD